jgi:DNA modification methylase
MDKGIAQIDTRCGDALDLFKDVQGGSVDLIVADPPYNLGKDYGNNIDSKEKQEYLKFTRQWLQESKRVLKPTGSIYVFMGVRFISYLYMILEDDLGMDFNSWIVWHYTQGIGKKKGLSPRHDDILFFTRSSKFKFNVDEIKIPQKYYRAANNMRGANPGNVWKFSHVHYSNPNRQSHPTQKPEGLIERIVLASSNKGDVVLDPFSGSGTTQRVCQQLERNCIGFEKNPNYVQMTNERLAMPFNGFDSSDDRNFRIPNDLRDPAHRLEYLVNHATWFLRHHESDKELFYNAVKEKYGVETLAALRAAISNEIATLQFETPNFKNAKLPLNLFQT